MIVIIARFFYPPVCSRILSLCRGALVVIVHQLALPARNSYGQLIFFHLQMAFLIKGGQGGRIPTFGQSKAAMCF